MHIVVEGPDGSGKTTLIDQLMDSFELTKHARSCTSLGGPLPDVDVWGMQTSSRIVKHESTHNYLFDRIPFISGPIYTHALGNPPQRGYSNVGWWESWAKLWFPRTLLIVCLPPFENVETNVRRSENMPGVSDNTARIYAGYDALKQSGVLPNTDRDTNNRPPVWRGLRHHYDYTEPYALQMLKARVGHHIGQEPR